jgi:hypothetical protein
LLNNGFERGEAQCDRELRGTKPLLTNLPSPLIKRRGIKGEGLLNNLINIELVWCKHFNYIIWGSAGIGRQPGLRIQCRKAWGFKSPLPQLASK